ncbi:hypothetical protein D3C85_1665320 [compost metagenome]
MQIAHGGTVNLHFGGDALLHGTLPLQDALVGGDLGARLVQGLGVAGQLLLQGLERPHIALLLIQLLQLVSAVLELASHGAAAFGDRAQRRGDLVDGLQQDLKF